MKGKELKNQCEKRFKCQLISVLCKPPPQYHRLAVKSVLHLSAWHYLAPKTIFGCYHDPQTVVASHLKSDAHSLVPKSLDRGTTSPVFGHRQCPIKSIHTLSIMYCEYIEQREPFASLHTARRLGHFVSVTVPR